MNPKYSLKLAHLKKAIVIALDSDNSALSQVNVSKIEEIIG